MIGKGNLSSIPVRNIRVMLGAHLFWLFLVCLLGGWWGRLLLQQAAKIAHFEKQLGWASDFTLTQWHRTQRMLYWEFTTFFGLLVIYTVFLFWMYWRDVQRSRSIQVFFASVTHELRTPLTSIRLQAESIAEQLENESPQRNLIQRLLEDALRLECQVERTLELARLEGGGPVFIQPVQLKPFLDRFIKRWQADYPKRVRIHSTVEDLWVNADLSGLQVIFKNLLENSLKHTKKEFVDIVLSSAHRNGLTELTIQDNGDPYSGEIQKLGKLFLKGPHSQGTGVGLYLVQVLMRRMGGKVHFVSRNGFQVVLSFQEAKLSG